MTHPYHIRIVVIEDEDLYVGQGIEHDICAQGSTLEEMQDRFDLTVYSYRDIVTDGFRAIKPPPTVFGEMIGSYMGSKPSFYDSGIVYDYHWVH